MDIFETVKGGDIEEVQECLDNGADVNAKNSIGETALMLASENGRTETCKLLMEKGADVNAKNDGGWTALMWASWNARYETCKLLVENKANVNAKDDNGKTALMMASENGHAEICECLLQAGADPTIKNKKGKTALDLAKKEKIKKLLSTTTTDTIVTKMFDIFKAVEEGEIKEVKKGLDSGIDVNLKDDEGWTALMRALENGKTEICKLLIEKGTDVNAKSNSGWTALMLASKNGNVEICKLLVKKGADVSAKAVFGQTALILASKNGHIEICKLLLENRADVNVKDNNGYAALLWASRNGHTEICKLLLENKADVNAKSNRDGSTALMWASQFGHAETCEYLLQAEADPTITNNQGKTAFNYTRNEKIKKLLEKAIGEPEKKRREGKDDKGKEEESDPCENVANFVLEVLGTDKYRNAFIENDITWELLNELDNDTLKNDIGMKSLGHRRLLLKAIESRNQDNPVTTTTTEPSLDVDYLLTDFDIEPTGHKTGGAHRIIMAKRKATGEAVALKIHENKQEYEHERDMLNSLRSEYIVELKDAKEYPEAGRYVLVEKRCRDTLADVFDLQAGGLAPADAQFLSVKACNCVRFLKDKGIVHSDLKPKNFGLVGRSVMRLVLLDLDGACVQYKDKLPTQVTLSYVAPERLLNENMIADPTVDLWSLGVMLYQMMTGKLLGVGMEEKELKKILIQEGDLGLPLAGIKPDSAKRLLERLLVRDPSKRVLEGSYVDGHQDTVVSSLVRDVKVIRKGVHHLGKT